MPDENCLRRQRWYENSRGRRFTLHGAWVVLVVTVVGGALVVGQNMNRIDNTEERVSEMKEVLEEVIKQNAMTEESQRWIVRTLERVESKLDKMNSHNE